MHRMNRSVGNLLDWYQIRIESHDTKLLPVNSYHKKDDDAPDHEPDADAHAHADVDVDFTSTIKRKGRKKSESPQENGIVIDVDLVKGSSFPKTKTKTSLFNITLEGISKIIFYPFYFRW
jgi:hypothetical protein